MTDFANLLDSEVYDPAAPPSVSPGEIDSAHADDPEHLARVGISLRDRGDAARAEAIFQTIIDRFPSVVFGWQEMAVLRMQQGRDDEALALRRRAVEAAPYDLLPRKNLAFQLLDREEPEEAVAVLRAHPDRTPEAAATVRALAEFVDFLTEYPRLAMIALVERFERSGRYLIGDTLCARIVSAVERAEPFSLIRLGDGEGAWLSAGKEDEARFAALYESNRRTILRVWFGSEALYGSRSFAALSMRMREAMVRCDVLGLPSGLRLSNEYDQLSIRSIPPCVNILRTLAPRLDRADDGQYCGQDAHLDLHLNRFWPKLLAMPVTFGVITCHPQLGYRLAERYGSRVTAALLVPEEKGFSQIAGISGMSEPHYPGAFLRILRRIEEEARHARVWLVAAGYLGKLYCDAIKQQGGVALDVGSIVDGWCGRITRPTMRRIEQFQL
ncbi:MAG: hypothetical protein JSR21_03895 [Proteobacteria bacterium]|nr:hypothetical protein [Pseudomonadota bacterium]